MVADAVALAERQIQSHRDESARLKSEISALDDQIGSTCHSYSTATWSRSRKKAIGQRIAKAQAEQDQLRAALDHVAEQSGQSAADLAEACREAFREARQTFADVATDSDFTDW
jgi:uncharacterized coiled-coil DUF342 family protein